MYFLITSVTSQTIQSHLPHLYPKNMTSYNFNEQRATLFRLSYTTLICMYNQLNPTLIIISMENFS